MKCVALLNRIHLIYFWTFQVIHSIIVTHMDNKKLNYTTPSVLVLEIGLCFPACLQTSNGATTENYEEEDIWNN